jgi:glycosyltransferase involved in cell wall biosynthesis
MRVGYVMSRFPKVTETFVMNEILELLERGFEVEIFPLLCLRPEVQHPEVERLMPRTHIHRLFSGRIAAANWRAFRSAPLRYLRLVARLLRKNFGSANHLLGGLAILPKSIFFAGEMTAAGLEHVHAHFANHPALCGWIIREWVGIPYSFTAHGSDIHVDQQAFDLKLEAASFAVMVSRYNIDFLCERFGPGIADKMELVHCGIDAEHFRPPSARSSSTCLRLLCVAALRRVKGHEVLVEACRLLAQQGIEFRCDLIGDGSMRAAIEAQVRRCGLEAVVALHGARPRDEVAQWMQRSDVLVLASIMDRQGRREAIPVTLMEAMASELPVVASRLSGIPELVEHERTGLLFPPGDAAALATALRELAAAPQRRAELGRAGREKVVQDFDLRKNTGRLAELFLATRGN